MVKAAIGTKVCSFEELLEGYGRVCEENEEFTEQISKLESELAKKETLLKIREDWCEECKEKSAIEKLKATPLVGKELPFADERYGEELIEELQEQHQQDCITINRLQTTIDILVDRYAKLREMREL